MGKANDGLDGLRSAARKRWGSATPFRLGYLVGEERLSQAVQCPYPEGSRGWHNYRDGVISGMTRVSSGPLEDSFGKVAG